MPVKTETKVYYTYICDLCGRKHSIESAPFSFKSMPFGWFEHKGFLVCSMCLMKSKEDLIRLLIDNGHIIPSTKGYDLYLFNTQTNTVPPTGPFYKLLDTEKFYEKYFKDPEPPKYSYFKPYY